MSTDEKKPLAPVILINRVRTPDDPKDPSPQAIPFKSKTQWNESIERSVLLMFGHFVGRVARMYSVQPAIIRQRIIECEIEKRRAA